MHPAIVFALLLTATLVSAGKNYYELLGISKTANEAAIKRAYRKLSLQYHPDKNKEEGASQMFTDIGNAYEVLSNKEKRRVYDQHGEEGIKKMGQQGQGHNPFDIFSQMGFGGQRNQEEQRGTDVTIELQASLEDLYLGKSVEVSVRGQQLCPRCRGTGADKEEDVKPCKSCGGKGVKMRMHQLAPGFVQQVQEHCDKCHGKGKIVTSKCSQCKGNRVVTGSNNLEVYIEQGMADGTVVTFENGADEHPDHAAGHLNFKITTAPHARFRRDGDDLHYEHRLTLLQALNGFSTSVVHLDGHTVSLSRSEVTDFGLTITIRGEGMPVHNNPSQKGSLHVHYFVDFPKKLSQAQKDGFAKLLA